MFARGDIVNEKKRGRLTIPTDVDIVKETKRLAKLWGADALRDCDGTEFPNELQAENMSIYATYYTTRKDNEWAKKNPDEVQQCYICTSFLTALKSELSIVLLAGFSPEMVKVNENDDIKRWWEVIDRTTGGVVSVDDWEYNQKTKAVEIKGCTLYHEYSVSFLAYLIWDPVHMYNAVVNDWKDEPHQMTFDVRQPKTKEYSKGRLRRFLEEKPYVTVVRFTTFFHQFTLLCDELRREKYVDWYGYSASVSPYILEQFEAEVGYPFRAEYIIDEGYYNNQYRVPSKQYRDFMAFQAKEVAKLAKEFVDIVHEYGKEAMMFLGDHFIGTEPFLDEFKNIGLDAVVGSVGNGSTLRLISEIQGLEYTEGRFLPYFFPDTFCKTGNPKKEAMYNWVTARRAVLRKPIDRIGYGGYLKLALDFPEFIDYITQVADEFRTLYENIKGTTPHCFKKVAILNAWGKARAWGCHMVHHALYHRENYSYAGILEILSGAPYDVQFISFEDILNDENLFADIDIIINVGDAGSAHSGGEYWKMPSILEKIRAFIYNGGAFVGVGEPTAIQHQGRFFQLGKALGVEKETGFTLGYAKYNKVVAPHFITENDLDKIDFGEGKKSIYALEGTTVLAMNDDGVQMASNEYGEGRCVYLSGLPYSATNAALLHRILLWASKDESRIFEWRSDNPLLEVHAYPKNKKFCIVNNSYEEQSGKVWTMNGEMIKVKMAAGDIKWLPIK